nr:hypothetical protein [Tanacetum cinerariifolium]
GNETTAAEIPSDRGKAPRIAAFTKDVVEAVVTMIPSVDNTNYRLSPIFISRELWVVVVVSIAYNLCGFDFFDRIKLVVPTPSASGGLITDVETLSEDNSALVDLVDEGVGNLFFFGVGSQINLLTYASSSISVSSSSSTSMSYSASKSIVSSYSSGLGSKLSFSSRFILILPSL